ncbi:MAG: response regulator [Lachnospiraceae bacterium]|nr:response regulator [Lachnospiraceae bacterium]
MKRNWRNLVITLFVTFFLMILMVRFTSNLIYRNTDSYIKEIGNDKTAAVTADMENYLEIAKSAIWVVSDTVDHMVQNNATKEEIIEYITRESTNTASYFDETYTGIYGVIDNTYIDGVGWVPPVEYDPTARDWYKTLVKNKGAITIVSPYVDAQTGKVIISVGRSLSNKNDALALDLTLNGVQEITEKININGNGYGYVLNYDGMVIAHKDNNEIGKFYDETDEQKKLFSKVMSTGKGNFEAEINGKECIVFVDEVMDQWHLVIVTEKDEMFVSQKKQKILSLIVSMSVFVLISTFYIIGFIHERKTNSRMEKMKANEQKRAYEAKVLQLEKSAADEANKAKSNFLADMSHEIRTPINAVLGMNEMILRKTEDKEILDYATNIKGAGNTLLSIINSILDFSKIEDGKMELIPVEFDMNDLIHSLVNSISERAREKKLEFIIDQDESLPTKLFGDDVRIAQVIMNLLTNAVKYTEKGTVTLSIRKKEIREEKLTFLVSVKDTGIGIRKEDIDKLAVSFERLDEKRNRHIEGTGLGISIVTRLLKMMDSKLQVESEYGRGSIFFFEMTLKIADATPIGKYEDRRVSGTRIKEENGLKVRNARILVTDDNDMNLKVASNFLKLFGVTPDLCSSGEATINAMSEKEYDIVFLDHMMPKMDGIETLQILKDKNLVDRDTVVIALTANAVVGAKEQYLQAGFTDYLSKPIVLKDLEKMLKKYLPIGKWTEDYTKEEGDTENTQSGGVLEGLEKLGLDTNEGKKYCGGEDEFYLEIVGDYANESEEKISNLSEFLKNGDMPGYRTLVHSIKSASKTIGSGELYTEAYELEKASADGNKEFVEKNHDPFIEKYRELSKEIMKIL